MISTFKLLSLLAITGLLVTSCSSKRGGSGQSSLTGWNFNDPNYGGYLKGEYKEGNNVPPGIVHIEGGTFTM